MIKVYIAAALFSVAEQQFNTKLRDTLVDNGIIVILPQEFDDSNGHIGLFQQCIRGVEKADVILAVVDGTDVDSGTSFEIGYAYAMKKPIVLLRTDFRENADSGSLNLMLHYAATKIIKEQKDPFNIAAAYVNGLTSFCEQHNLSAPNLHKVLKGKRTHHKGWRIERVT